MIIKDLKNPTLKAIRDGYGQGLVKAGQEDKQVVVLAADVTESTRSHLFKQAFPDRFFEIGVAEQNMMGIAAGLALSNKIPFVNSYAVFSPGRSWGQLRISVCYQKANVKIAGHHTGIHAGPDGVTHQATEDIALTRCLPHLAIITPCDALEAEKATLAAAQHQGPVYLRLSRNQTPVITTHSTPFTIGQAEIFRPGKDVTVVACGHLLYQALKAAEKLKKENISLEVINNHTIKPLDTPTILKSVQKTHSLVTVEDHQVMAGMGSAVIESLAQNYAAPVTEMIGIRDSFAESGQPEELLKKYHLDTDAINKAVKKVLARKKRL